MKAEIEVIAPGILTSIQDLGRFGFQKYGVPQSGVMDRYAMRMCNLLLGNSEDAAVMEITFQGPKLKFSAETSIVISGADLSPTLNDESISLNEVTRIGAGDTLKFGRRKSGMRAYLGIKDGFKTEIIMNSRSWYDDISQFSRLQKGMKIPYSMNTSEIKSTHASIKIEDEYLHSEQIEAYPGPEFLQLPALLQKEIFKKRFVLDGSSNRMAIQFEQNFENQLEPIITSPVLPGTVQLTPSGNLIVLMRDCQTTGGYPRVLQLSELGMQTLSQRLPGTSINFNRKDYFDSEKLS